MSQNDVFEFVDLSNYTAKRDSYVVHVAAGLTNKEDLLQLLFEKLEFPDGDFEFSWDSFSDGLRDLYWLIKYEVTLVHADLPPLPPADLSAYLQILSEAVGSWWKASEGNYIGDHELHIVFPLAVKATVESLVSTQIE